MVWSTLVPVNILFFILLVTIPSLVWGQAVPCGSPPSISNGSPGTPTRTTFGGTVTYSCNNGYVLLGSATVTCQASGSWSTRPTCTAIACPSLPNHDYGTITYSPDTSPPFDFGTQATYQTVCPEGLERNGGDGVRTCGGDGSSPVGWWSGITPYCSAQSVYLTHGGTTYFTNNSIITVTSIGTTDDNTLNCHTELTTCCRGRDNSGGGYIGFGEWVFPDGSNVPKNSDVITNGFVWDRGAQVVRLSRKGNVVDPLGTYCCKIPDRNGMTRTFCANLVAIRCPSLMTPRNQHIHMILYSSQPEDDRYKFGTVATYSCSSGFGLSSTQGRMCVGVDGGDTEGRFDGSEPTCEPVSCGSPPSIFNGYRGTPTSTTFGGTVIYSCNNGYVLSGSDTVTCQASRSWSTPPTCTVRNCGSPPSISNGSPGTPTRTTFGGTVTYSCNNGYVLSGSATVTCQASGSWSTRPTCTAITCTQSIPDHDYGTITYSPDTSPPFDFGTRATYQTVCPEGLERNGGDDVRTCGGDGSSTSPMGQWNGTAPVCLAQSVYLTHGGTTYFNNNSAITVTSIGTTDDNTLNCHTELTTCCRGMDNPDGGYIGFGEWVFPNGSNVSKNSDVITNGFVRDRGAQVVRLSHKGNVVDPLGTYCCKIPDRNGMTRTFCSNLVAIRCPPLMAINNEHITRQYSNHLEDDRYIFGTVATYSCSSGFGLSSTQGRMCVGVDGGDTAGEFDGREPTCEPITCSALPDVTNGMIVYSSDTSEPFDFGTTARYQCDDGYEIRSGDDVIRTCGGDGSSPIGQWSGTTPVCSAVSCGSPPSISNGSPATPTSTTFGGTVTYNCDDGYVLSGSATVTCQASGSWSNRPTCTDFDECSSSVTHNCAQVCTNIGGSFICSCLSGYDLNNDGRGCDPRNCGSPPSIFNGSPGTPTRTTFGGTVTYSCNSGYVLSGSTTVTCQPSGSWSIRPICTAICPDLPPPTNGVIIYSPTSTPRLVGNMATYSCDSGYTLSGGTVRTCQSDRTWSGRRITCQSQSVYMSLGGTIYYTNNSAITVTSIGTTDDNILNCNTDQTTCCRGADNPHGSNGFGEWVFPNGSNVPKNSDDITNGFVRDKGAQVVRLSRKGNVVDILGTYCCRIPDRNGMTRTFCANLIVAIRCPPLMAINNEHITRQYSNRLEDNRYIFGTVATYSCSSGFGLSSTQGRMCVGGDGGGTEGRFDGSEPTCEPITCPALPGVTNGMIVYSSDTTEPFDFGTTTRYQCDDGYEIVGDDVMRTCGGDGSSPIGEWSGIDLVCSAAVSCGSPPSISNGSHETPTRTTFGGTVTYSCDNGYVLLGSATIMCMTNRIWSTRPTCQGVQINRTSDTTLDLGDTVTISCRTQTPNIPTDVIMWLNGDSVIAQVNNRNSLDLMFSPVNDSIHGNNYTCEAILTGQASSTPATSSIVVNVQVPPNVISTTITPSRPNLQQVGMEYILTCTVSKEIDGLTNTPSAQWFDNNGQVFDTDFVYSTTSDSEAMSTLTFSPLKTSHAGSYICSGSITSPALSQPLVVNGTKNITLKIPDPSVTLTPPPPVLYANESEQTFICRVSLNRNIDTDVVINLTWVRSFHNREQSTRQNQIRVHSSVSMATDRLVVTDLSSRDDSLACAVIVTAIGESYLVNSNEIVSNPTDTTPNAIRTEIVTPSVQQRAGETYSLTCAITGADSFNPTISYQWFKHNPSRTQVGTASSTVTFDPLVLSDVGRYSCEAMVSSTQLTQDFRVVSDDYEIKFSSLNIQLRFNGVTDCGQYILLDPSLKTADITTSLSQGISRFCQCIFNTSFITNTFLKCFENSPQHVTYRAVLTETRQVSTVQFVSYIKLWSKATRSLVVQSIQLGFDTTCPVVIVNSDSPECPEAIDFRGSSDSNSSEGNGVVIGAVVACVLIVVVIVVAGVVIAVLVLRHRRISSMVEPNVNSGLKSQTIPLNELKQSPLPLVYETVGQPNTAHPQSYEIVEVSHEYEDLEKFQKEGEYEKVETVEPRPPTVDYEITECPAYLPTGTEEGHTHQE